MTKTKSRNALEDALDALGRNRSNGRQVGPDYAAHGFVGVRAELWARVLWLSHASQTLAQQFEGCDPESQAYRDTHTQLAQRAEELKAAMTEIRLSAIAQAPAQTH